MKTLIITSRDRDNCYNRIREKWFSKGNIIRVTTNARIVRSDLQSLQNNVRFITTEDYRLCLPSCVNPELSVDDRTEYALALVCAISVHFEVPKDELYVLFHAGDLFNIGDQNRITGALYFDNIYGTPERMDDFESIVEENHLFRFRHDSDISDMLLFSNDKSVSTLCAALIHRIEQR